MMDDEERVEIGQHAEQTVDEAVEFAEQSPEPDPSGLLDSLYVNPPANV